MKPHWILSLTTLGFGLSFIFYFWEAPNPTPCKVDCGHYILFRQDLYFDMYSHVYLIFERVFLIITYFIIYRLSRSFYTLTLFILFCGYLIDYLLFFNDPPIGFQISYAKLVGGVLIILTTSTLIQLYGSRKHH